MLVLSEANGRVVHCPEGSWAIPWKWVTHSTPPGSQKLAAPKLDDSSNKDLEMKSAFVTQQAQVFQNPKGLATEQMLLRH